MEAQELNEIFSISNILLYLLVINIVTFLVMWYDKHEAKIHQWRVSEKSLFLLVMFGGGIGGITGMYIFHHKTKKWYFKFGLPFIVICQVLLVISIKNLFNI